MNPILSHPDDGPLVHEAAFRAHAKGVVADALARVASAEAAESARAKAIIEQHKSGGVLGAGDRQVSVGGTGMYGGASGSMDAATLYTRVDPASLPFTAWYKNTIVD